jgi:hypothetical protein
MSASVFSGVYTGYGVYDNEMDGEVFSAYVRFMYLQLRYSVYL